MISGIKTTINGDFCAYCNNKVNTEEQDFCSQCGSPLTENGRKLRHEQIVSEKINLLGELSSQIKDEKALKVIANKIKEL